MIEDYSAGDRDIFGDENSKVFEICVTSAGTIDFEDNSINKADEVYIDISSIKQNSSMNQFISLMEQRSSSISSLRQKTTDIEFVAKGGDFDCRPEFVCMKKEPPSSSGALLNFIFDKTLLPRLITLNLSYVNFTGSDFQVFCDALNPSKGRASITKLTLYRCELDDERTSKLFKEICGNILLTYIDLTSNRIGDEGVKAIVESLSYHEAQTKYLALGNNNFSDEAVNHLNQLFSLHRSHMKYFHIPNNHKISDRYLDQSFYNILYIGRMRQLTLAGCHLVECDWSRYLPFLRSLQILNLSYNSISDRGIYKILLSLKLCFSLIEVDLSYNKFRYYHVQVLKDLLEVNESLQHFHLNGNRFYVTPPEKEKDPSHLSTPTIWSLISLGIAANKTLLTFSLQDCGMKLENLKELLPALQKNDRVNLMLENNPLPLEAIKNVRRFYQSEWKILPLSRNRELATLTIASEWRREQKSLLEKELESLAVIVDEKRKAEAGNRSTDSDFSIDQQVLQKLSPVSMDQEKEELDEISPLSSTDKKDINHSSLDTNIVSAQAITNLIAFQRLIWSQNVIERSNRYRTVEELHKLVEELEMQNTVDSKFIDIAFGREAFILGNVQIFSHTTYDALRALVEPLVMEHATTVDSTKLDEFIQFKISDPNGKIVETELDLKSRRVWSEIFDQEHPVIVLRPSTWLSL